ncbi:MAG: 50S ribosomal protein L23 [Candidatus Desulfovibrio faecigallinarum]|nr:50S ribosomal protein L23 [Candidatus Desulfovibrio faecigallinarum]
MELTQVLIKPLISEKSTALQNDANAKRVTFLVHPDANKAEIRRAVETVFGVKVLKVNVVRGKARDYVRQSRRQCHQAGYKKAFVTLPKESKIEYFEGA